MVINEIKLIGVSGKAQSGKDEFGKIYKYIMAHYRSNMPGKPNEEDYLSWQKNGHEKTSFIETKKYADKLKDIVCILLNCTREQLEDPVYKEKPLGKSWDKWELRWHFAEKIDGLYTTYEEALEALLELGGGEWDAKNAITKIIMTPRLLMQLVGTDCGRQIIHPDIWVNATFAEYKPQHFRTVKYQGSFVDHLTTMPNWIITDVRFPNEVKAIEERGGFVVRMIRYPQSIVRHVDHQYVHETFGIENPIHRRHYEEECRHAHASERALDEHDFKHYIFNDGTIGDLINKVMLVMKKENIIG